LPEYTYVQEENRSDLDRIPLDAKEPEIEEAIANIHFRNQQTGRDLINSVVAEIQKHATFDAKAFAERFDEEFERITKINQASLISYLIFRKSIIDILEQVLKKASDRFQREATVHELIFPMRREHEPSKAFMEHNLWLVDERLTYASYIASDLGLNQHKVLFEVDDPGEPDIAAYFNIGFSSDSLDGPLHNVVIVEFKRPGPLKRRDESPHEQVLRYMTRIRDGFYNENGQKIKAALTTRFYCYIVCDLDSEEVTRMRDWHQYKPIFDGEDGYFLYHDPYRAYIELVPFERLLRSAKRNHRAFFERAGLLTGNGLL
jgi:hypothetical protein